MKALTHGHKMSGEGAQRGEEAAARAPRDEADGRAGANVLLPEEAAIEDEQHAERMRRLAAAVFSSTNEAIIIADTQRNIVAVNKAFSRITGFAAEEVIGRNPRL